MNRFHALYRRRQYSRVIPVALMLGDAAIIVVALQLSFNNNLIGGFGTSSNWMLTSTYALVWVLSNLLNLGYFVENLSSYRRIILTFLKATLLYGFLLFLIIAPGFYGQEIKSLVMLYAGVSSSLLVIRVITYLAYRKFSSHPANRKNTILIGYNKKSKKLFEHFSKDNSSQNKVLGVFDNKAPGDLSVMSLYFYMGLENVQEFCLNNNVSEIYFALNPEAHSEYIESLSKFVDKHFIYLGFIGNADKIDFEEKVEAKFFDNGQVPVISYRRIPLRYKANLIVKRIFDLAFSASVLLILGLSIFPLIAIAIKLTSPGPVFFKQPRPGYGNKNFLCYKFRTMVVNTSDVQTKHNDPRITTVGNFLRRTSLDELPQFINVLRGEMSVVGPRPNLILQLREYSKSIDEYSVRHTIPPGITGYAQVNGFRGATNDLISMQKRVEHDIWYLNNWTLSFDIQIIANTLYKMVKGDKNAY